MIQTSSSVQFQDSTKTTRSASISPPSTSTTTTTTDFEAFINAQTWTNRRNCPDDGCDEACCLSQHDEEKQKQFTSIASRTKLGVDVSDSNYFVDKRVRISGRFKGATKEQLAELIRVAGALAVTTNNRNLGDANVVIAGIDCCASLRAEAQTSGIDVLTQSQAIHYLRGTDTTDTSDTTLPDESDVNLFPAYHKKAIFRNPSETWNDNQLHLCMIEGCCTWNWHQGGSVMCRRHSKKFNNVAPPGMSRQVTVWKSSLDYQYGSFVFKDDNGRSLEYKCTRLKLKGESEWIVVNERFMTKDTNHTFRWCLTHGKFLQKCSHCNDCSHGFVTPKEQCIKCYPHIACVACGLVPRRVHQTNIS